jgi:hypothetical protein
MNKERGYLILCEGRQIRTGASLHPDAFLGDLAADIDGNGPAPDPPAPKDVPQALRNLKVRRPLR